jgi:type I restriction enzyme S subunit
MTALLTDNLPLLADAPNGIKKLRELILELAVRGKLVEQNASDEPAGELLKRIAAEKARLLAGGKIKKQKPQAEIAEEEVPFILPHGWCWARLGEAGISATGKTPSTNNPKFFGGELPFMGPGQINVLGEISDPDKWLTELAREETSVAEPNDLLMVCIGGSIGKCAIADREMAFNQQINSIRPLLANHRYVFNAVSSPIFKAAVWAAATGTATPIINRSKWDDLLISIPPLPEQHRIVAKVDELMALCDRLETQQTDGANAHVQLVQALLGSLTQASDATEFSANWQRLAEHFHTLFSTEASLDALKQTLLQLAVMGKLVPQDPTDEPVSEMLKRIQAEKQRLLAEGQSRKQKELLTENIPLPPYGVPNGWAWEILDSILYITGGVTLGRKLAGREMVSKPYLRVANVQRGYLALDVMKEVEVPEDEVSKYLLKDGDLLITEGGDWDKVGRTAVWRDELPECLHQNHVFRARALTDEFEPRWAEMYLNSTTARDYFAGSSKQTTNLASINMTQLRSCAFPMPPLAEQHRIVAKVDQMMALCDQLKTQLSLARQLNQQLSITLVEQAVA